MTRCLFIRHAPTAWNEERRLQGRADPPLSAAGRAAAAAWRLPAGYASAACLVSPLRRAVETAKLLGFPRPSVDARLIEMDWGAFEGQRLADLRASMPVDLAAQEARGLDFRPPGGESPRDVTVRLAPLLAELGAMPGPFVIVTHKGLLRALIVLATGWPMLGRAPLKFAKGQGVEVEINQDGALSKLRVVPLGPGGSPCGS